MDTIHAIAYDTKAYIGPIPSPEEILSSAIRHIEPAPMVIAEGKVYGNNAGLSLIDSFETLKKDVQLLKLRADASDMRAEASGVTILQKVGTI